jgi:hypothetical protein
MYGPIMYCVAALFSCRFTEAGKTRYRFRVATKPSKVTKTGTVPTGYCYLASWDGTTGKRTFLL